MSRQSSRKKTLKAPEGKIIVKSETYGEHLRARRKAGSYPRLSNVFKENSRHMIGSNIPAQLIHNALKPYRENFPGGQLWQRLLRHFTAQAKKKEHYSVVGIENWDVNKKYLTSQLMAPNLKIKRDSSSTQLVISLNYEFSKRFLERKSNISGFQITIILFFPDFVRNEIVTIPNVMPEKKLDDHSLYSFIVQIPAGASSYIACFKAEACVGGVPIETKDNVRKAMSLSTSAMLSEVEEIGERD